MVYTYGIAYFTHWPRTIRYGTNAHGPIRDRGVTQYWEKPRSHIMAVGPAPRTHGHSRPHTGARGGHRGKGARALTPWGPLPGRPGMGASHNHTLHACFHLVRSKSLTGRGQDTQLPNRRKSRRVRHGFRRVCCSLSPRPSLPPAEQGARAISGYARVLGYGE